jgi:hypothetical protein
MRTPEAAARPEVETADPKRPSVALPDIDELKRLRQRQIEALGNTATEDPAIMNGLLARVQSLSAAIALLEEAKGKAGARRLATAAWVGAVLLTGTLLLLHRPSAEILVDTKATHVSFTVATSFAPLRGIAGVTSVELAGLAKIQQEGTPDIAAGPNDDLLFTAAPDMAAKNPGSIGVDSLVVPPGTRVELTAAGEGKTIDLRFQYPAGSSPRLDLDVTGDMIVHLRGQRRASFTAPERITGIPTGDGQLVLAFRSPEIIFPAPVLVESVLWKQDTRSLSPYPGGARPESSILSGKLSFEEFKDNSVNLRRGELLNLSGALGQIRELRSDGQVLSSQFDGAVKELSTGEGNRRRNLMPTWLEWLRGREALFQFWALAGYLAAMGLTIGRWWRESK